MNRSRRQKGRAFETQRQRLSGLMNYGYEGEVYLPVPVEIPATAKAGTVQPLTVKALFLVCSAEMCVPDELTLRLDLPVRDWTVLLAWQLSRLVRLTLRSVC